jgi:hypothetical protein|tara:strand:+ start:1627 stop:3006 length:1380 start_codon:yes stop_codon:yes gene_type:complete
MDLDNILSTHPAYDEVSTQAQYLYRSYVGGQTYRAGQYLTHYIGEDQGPGDQYGKRLLATPLDNHVQTTIDIYRSFLFREAPSRELGSLAGNASVEDWLDDTDQAGQSMNSFLKTANDLALVVGNIWILVDKPIYKVQTRAEEEALGIRAYCATYTPDNVLNWEYERNLAGKMVLNHIKVKESDNSTQMVVTCWYPDYIVRYVVAKDENGEPHVITSQEQFDNPLGYIPFVNHMPLRSPVQGVGYSLVADVADGQRYIYNLLSELETTIRISGHPTLVKTQATSAAAGAGAIIQMDNDMDPGLKPYLLQPTAAGVNGILDSIDKVVEGIHRMTHTAAVQATKNAPVSGTALMVERQLLNAKLTDIADTLQETEYKLWDIWFNWQAIEAPADFDITYSMNFDAKDQHSEVELYRKAIEVAPNAALVKYLQEDVARMLIDDPEDLNIVLTDMNKSTELPEA